MRLLALDTAGAELSAACDEAGSCLVRREPLERGHAERVLPLLQSLMAEAGWRWSDLDLLAVTLGPGGFTGLRAGIATARALALALDRPALGVGSLEALAEAGLAAAPPELRDRPFLAVMRAQRGELVVQRFDGALRATSGPLQGTPARMEELWQPGMWLAGDVARACLSGPAADAVAVEVPLCARYVARLARRRLAAGVRPGVGSELRPFYLRPPDARLDAGRPLVARPNAR